MATTHTNDTNVRKYGGVPVFRHHSYDFLPLDLK